MNAETIERNSRRFPSGKSIAVIGVPQLRIEHGSKDGRPKLSMIDTIAPIEIIWRTFGLNPKTMLIPNRHFFANPLAINRTPLFAPYTLETSTSHGEQRIPLSMLTELLQSPLANKRTQTKPAAFDLVQKSDVTVIAACGGMTRHCMTQLAENARQSVVIIDDLVVEHAGPGSFAKLGRACEVMVVTSPAAQIMTASENDVNAARCLDNLSNSATIVVVSKSELTCRHRGKLTIVPLAASNSRIADVATRVGGTFAVGLLEQQPMDQIAFAAARLATMDQPIVNLSLGEWIEQGRQNTLEITKQRCKQEADRHRGKRLAVLAATGTALVGLALGLTQWIANIA